MIYFDREEFREMTEFYLKDRSLLSYLAYCIFFVGIVLDCIKFKKSD